MKEITSLGRFAALATVLLLSFGLLSTGETAASANTETAPVSPQTSEPTDSALEDRLQLTEAEMDELTAGMTNSVDGVLTLTPTSPTNRSARAANPVCHQDSGIIWERTSGKKKYKYGSIGGKPSILCNMPVAALSLTSTIYQKNSLGFWVKVAGPFTSANVNEKKLQPKNVEYVCKKNSPKTPYRLVVNGSVTYPGLKPIPGGSYSETDKLGLSCK